MPKTDGINRKIKEDFKTVGESFPPNLKKLANSLPIIYAADKIPETAKIGKGYRKIFLSGKSPSAKTALVTDFSVSGFTKPNSFSPTEWTADNMSPKALYFFMKRLYTKL